MATWRVSINYGFEITSDQLDAFGSFKANRGGPKGDLAAEKLFLDDYCRDWLDKLARFDVMENQTDNHWNLRSGAAIKSGTDGNFNAPSEFRSASVSLAVADVGRIIHVTAGAPAARGFWRILSREGPNSVTIDGIVPVDTAANLTFDIHDPGDMSVELVSDP